MTYFIAAFIVFELSNSVLAVREFRFNYSASEEQVRNAERLNEYLDGVKGNILIVDDASFVENKLIDTYVRSEYCVINEDQIKEAYSAGECIDLNATKFQTIYKNYNTTYSEYSDFDYIISFHELPFAQGKVEEIENVEWDNVHVYRNLFPTQLWLEY